MTRTVSDEVAFGVARVLHAVFWLATSLYCALTYSVFVYRQFLAPQELDWIFWFSTWHHAIYWIVFLCTVLTLRPQLRAGRGRALAWAYVVAGVVAGAELIRHPVLVDLASTPRSLWFAFAALVPMGWLGVVDHLAIPWPSDRGIDAALETRRRARVCGVLALYTWVVYASFAVALRHNPGIHLSAMELTAATGWAGVLHLLAFFLLCQLLLIAVTLGQSTGMALSPRRDYVIALTAMVASIAIAIGTIVWPSLSFPKSPAWALSWSVAVAVVIAWSSLALRWRQDGGRDDGFFILFSSLGGPRRFVAMIGLVALPVFVAAAWSVLPGWDWDFILQKLSVAVMWVLAFGFINALVPAPRRHRAGSDTWRLALASAAIIATYELALALQRVPLVAVSRQAVLEQYTAINPSFRVIDNALNRSVDASGGRAVDREGFFDVLRSNSNIPPSAHAEPASIDFTSGLRPSPSRKPDIFLLVIDSLRRDYVSTYNPAVTFTPELARFAAGSLVFRNAFTRYGGTGLAVPSIWSGSLLLHKQYVLPFAPMNSLHKLIAAEGYRRVMSMDSIMRVLDPATPDVTEIDRGITNVQFDLCRSLEQFVAVVNTRDPRPLFAYSLPQNIHMVNVQRGSVPGDQHHPGFYERIAWRLERIDGCFGRFIDALKAQGRYDNSIIIVTSDHGDSLGEEGRYWHGNDVFPEIMRIPLIMHLPSEMMRGRTADLDRVSFSTDIAPTLYTLLGQTSPLRDSMYGQSLIADSAVGLPDRRLQPFVLASSYGPTYAVLTRNGRRLYVANAVRGREYYFDLTGADNGRQLPLTDASLKLFRGIVRAQIEELAGLFHFRPEEQRN